MKPRYSSTIQLLAAASMVMSPLQAADLYWKTSSASSWSGSFWGTSPGGPYTNAYVSGSSVVFEDNGGAALTITGATTNFSSITANENVTVTASGTLATGGTVAPITVAAGKTLDLAGQNLSTAAGTGFIKNGEGTLTLANGNAYAGGFTLDAGTVRVGGVNALGSGGALVLNGGTLSSNSTSARDLSGKFAGGITIGGNLTLGDSTNTGTLTFSNAVSLGSTSRTLNIAGGATAIFNGVISSTGTAGLIKTGSGSIDFGTAANNTIAGNSAVRAGNVFMRHANAFGSVGSITLGDTTGSSSATLRATSITVTRPIVLETGTTGTLVVNNLGSGAAPVYQGGVTGTNNLTIQSVIGSAGASTVTFNTGTINHVGSLTLSNTGTGTATGATGTVDIATAITSNVTSVTVTDASSGTKGLQRSVLGNATNAYTGNTTINTGARLELSVANVIPDGSGKGNVTVNGTLDLRGGSETINGLGGTGTINRSTAGSSTLTVGGNGATSTFSGLIQNGGGTLALAKTGSGTLTLDTAHTHSGGTTVGNGGGVLAITNGSALGSGTAAIPKSGTSTGTLEVSGGITVPNNFTFASATGLSGAGSAHIRNTAGNNTLSGNLTLTATGGNGINLESAAGKLLLTGTVASSVADNSRTLSLGGSGDGEISGNIVDTGAFALMVTKTGTGTWKLSGTGNTYSGATTVNAGTLSVTQPAFADASTVAVSTGATLNLDFAGTDTVSRFTLDNVTQTTGIWGAVGSGAAHETSSITGTGMLLVSPTEFVWNDSAGDFMWSTAGNWDVNTTPTPGSSLRFPNTPDTGLTNDFAAGTSFAKLIFSSGAPSYTMGGNNLVLTTGVDNLSTSLQTLDFPIELGADIAFNTNTGNLALTGNLTGSFGFTKTGSGELILSGTNTYTGTTTLNNGWLTIQSATALPSSTTLAFTNSGSNTAQLDISDRSQSVAGMTFGTQTTGAGFVKVYGTAASSLTTSPASLLFAPAASTNSAALTVDMSAIGAFTYHNAAGSVALQAGVSTGTGTTTVTLPNGSNTITAASLNLAGLNAASGNKSILNLGLNNTLHANAINLAAGSGRASATLQFAPGLATGGTLEIRNSAGTGPANITVGKNSSFNGDGTVYTSVFDTTGNAATLDALVGTLTVGNAQIDSTGASRQASSNGTFRMGLGTLTATTANIGVLGGVTPTGSNNHTATGLLSLNGGTANITTLTVAHNGLPSVIGTANLNGQITLDGTGGSTRLNATTIQQGTVVTGETSRLARINWIDGTIGNLSGSDLAVSGVTVVLSGAGVHAFDVSSGQTATVTSDISSAAAGTPLTKTGAGTLVLSGANSYSGETSVNAGTLETTTAFLDDASAVSIAAGAKLKLGFSGTDIVGSLVINGTPMAAGTTYGATGSGASVIDDAHFSGTGKIQVGTIADPFTPWIAGFGLTGGDAAKSADPDGDGQTNLLEFALDGHPGSGANTGKSVCVISGNYLTLTLPVRDGAVFSGSGPLVSSAVDGVVYRIEGDDDLSGFTSGVEETTALSAGLPALNTGWTYRTFRLSSSVNSAPRGFIRAGAGEAP